MNSLTGNFEQTVLDKNQRLLQQSSGKLLLRKPQQLRWMVNQPDESVLIADGKTVYNVDPFVEQVTLMDQKQMTERNPLMLLVSDMDQHWQQVAVSKTENSFEILSLDEEAFITSVILQFDGNGQLKQLISFDKQQQENRLSLSDVEINQALDAKSFQFEIPVDWIIDDQRSTD